MHEYSLCEGVLKVLQEQAAAQDFRRVRTVWLEVGELAGVDIEAMRFGFDLVMKGSLAENALLEIITIPGKAWCPVCMKEFAIRQRFDSCPKCDGYALKMVSGEEMRVKELEVS